MEDTQAKKIVERDALRLLTEAAVTCRTLTSSGIIRASNGTLYNFSSEGAFIETTGNFKTGSILIVQVIDFPHIPSSMDDEAQPRSICLAEVKWNQQRVDENAVRYGMGLKYLI